MKTPTFPLLVATTLAVAARTAELIMIDGSSTVYPAKEAVAGEFMTAKRGKVRITVGISGTSGGLEKFTQGETDFSDASRPILAAEMEAARANGIEYFELPICFDVLTVVVNPQNTWCSWMTASELMRLWEPAAQRTIRRWNQTRPDWPDAEIMRRLDNCILKRRARVKA